MPVPGRTARPTFSEEGAMSDSNLILPKSPVMPQQLAGDHLIQFRCHKDIACFNACCQNIDITLTPYDLLRLKRHFGITSQEVLSSFTVPFEMDSDGMPGVKLRTSDDTMRCPMVTDAGCSIYEDRPTACRYYPVAMLSMRKTGATFDEQSYALVREAHCLGHDEPREITIDDYRREQQIDTFDELARGWRQLILKKKSLGPKVGKPSKRSLQLFFLASYNIDGFRDFVTSPGFRATYDLDDAEFERLTADDDTLLQFGFRLLRQVLFGEETIPVRRPEPSGEGATGD